MGLQGIASTRDVCTYSQNERISLVADTLIFLFEAFLSSWNRELEVLPELCPKSLLLFAFSIIIITDFCKNVQI